jgi:mannosyltransferase
VSAPSTITPPNDPAADSEATGGGRNWDLIRIRKRYGLLVGVCAVTGFLGVFRLGAKSIWSDEAFSDAVARLDLPTMGRVLSHGESFNGLYYALLHLWQLGGHSETWLRLPSVIFGVLAAWVLFALHRRLFGVIVALAAAALLAVNAFFVYYEQDARPYSLAVFLVVLATYLFVRALEDPSIWRWLGYGGVGALAIYAHLFSAFVIAAHLSSLLIRRPRPKLRTLAVGFGLIAVLVAPLLRVVLTTDPLEREFIDPVHLGSFRWLFLNLTGGGGLATTRSFILLLAYFGVCCLGLLWMLRAVRSAGNDRAPNGAWSFGLILLWFGVPIIGSFALSLFRSPIFYPRYLIVALPPLVTIASIGISGLRHRSLQVAAVAAIVVLSLLSLQSYYRSDFKEAEDWRRAVAYVVEGAQPGDGVVFFSRYGRRPFEYYLERSHAETDLRPVYPDLAWGRYAPVLADLNLQRSTETAAERLRTGYERVWVVLIWGGFANRDQDAEPLKDELDRNYTIEEEGHFGAQVQVRLYQRTGT